MGKREGIEGERCEFDPQRISVCGEPSRSKRKVDFPVKNLFSLFFP